MSSPWTVRAKGAQLPPKSLDARRDPETEAPARAYTVADLQAAYRTVKPAVEDRSRKS